MSSTLQVALAQVGPSTSKATARSHTVLIDRPESKGGTDRGPLGGEMLLVGFGGCFMSNLLAAIRARNVAVSNVRMTIEGTMDGAPERFTRFTVRVSADHDDPALVHKLIGIAERACAVTNTLRQCATIEILFEGERVTATAETIA